jgi:hypothetical protein
MKEKVIRVKLSAPGRMDVVEKVIRGDPFFRSQAQGSSRYGRRNRRGVQKRYSELTVFIVLALADAGLDAITMRRDEIIAWAFKQCQSSLLHTVLL